MITLGWTLISHIAGPWGKVAGVLAAGVVIVGLYANWKDKVQNVAITETVTKVNKAAKKQVKRARKARRRVRTPTDAQRVLKEFRNNS